MLDRLAYPFFRDQQATVRWNFAANVMDGALYAFAMSFVSLTTVMPILVKKLGGTNMAVGMIPVLWTLGTNIPQILMAGYTERHPDKKRLLLTTALIQRAGWLLTAVLILLSVYFLPSTALVLFFAGFTIIAVGSSVNMPAWFDLVARITPTKLRGRLFGIRMIMGSALGILGGYLVVVILERYPFPTNFSVLFFIAFALTMVSYVFLVMLRDDSAPVASSGLKQERMWRRIPGILRTQQNFRVFLIADSLLVVALVANAFYAVHAFERFGLSPGYVGYFTIVMTATSVVASLIFGYVADRVGHRVNLLIAAGAFAVTSVAAVFAPSVWVYFAVFLGSALVVSLRHISRLPIIAELCSEADRPTYVALSNLVTAPLVLVALLAGWAADMAGYEVIFVVAAFMAIGSAALLHFRFSEPRDGEKT